MTQAGAGADPAVLADARQKLANIEFLRGHLPRSPGAARAAEVFWDRVPRAYAEERRRLGMRARLQRARGDLRGDRTSRAAIAQRTALSGRNIARRRCSTTRSPSL